MHFTLSLVQTQRAAQCSGGLGAWCAQALAVAYETLFTLSHLSAPVECLSMFSLLYPCMNGCKVNQLLGKPESASNKAPELTRVTAQCPRFVHGPSEPPGC